MSELSDLLGAILLEDHTIDYSPVDVSLYLPLPESGDDISTLTIKMEDLSEIVQHQKSIALYTGFKKGDLDMNDAESIARLAMAPDEVADYDNWKRGTAVPEIDWQTSTKPVTRGPKTLHRFERLARALSSLWNMELNASNARWLYTKRNDLVPLVVATSKVQTARDYLGDKGKDELEVAEVQILHRAAAVSIGSMNKVCTEMKNNGKMPAERRKHVKYLVFAVKILQGREFHLRRKLKYEY